MKKLWLLLLSFLIGLGLFNWLGQVVGWSEIKDAFLLFHGWHGLAIFGLTLLIALIGTWKWQEILKGMKANIAFSQVFKPYLMGFAIMFLAPILFGAGELFRAYILKKRNSISWPKGAASVICERILEWTVNLLVIFFGILFFLFAITFPPKKIVLIFGFIFLVFVLGISYFYLKVFKKESIFKVIFSLFGLKKLKENSTFLEIEKEMFLFFKPKQAAFWKALGLSFLKAGAMYLRALLLILFLGKNAGFLPIFSILGFSYLAAMIPIPTALGSHEAIQMFAFGSLGLGVSSATVFTMVIRGAEILISFIGLFLIFKLGLSLLKSKLLAD